MRPESTDTTDTLDKLTEEAFTAWEPMEPPKNFAASVMAAASDDGASIPIPAADPILGSASGGSRWGVRGLLLGVAVAAVAAATGAALLFGGDPKPIIETGDKVSQLGSGTPNAGPTIPKGSAGLDFEPAPLPADLNDRIDGYISSHGRLYGEVFRFHGTIIVARDGDVVYRRSYGDAVRASEGEAIPHRPDTRHRIGTLTQQITATAIMMLVERGAISLDDPLAKHLPDYPEEGREITIRQLLNHSSGIPSFTDEHTHSEWRAEPHTTASLLARFSAQPLEFKPGAEFDPSNSGYAVLGAVIEAVTGASYGEFVQREIFGPLAMERSTVGEPPAKASQANGYLFSEDEQLLRFHRAHLDLSSFGAAGNIVTTADDLSRWAIALFEGRVLEEETLDLMLTAANEDGYALGWIPEREFGQDVVSHPGGTEGINAAIRYYRGDRTLILAIANNDVIDARSVVEEVGQITHGRSPTPPIEREEVDVDTERFHLYGGHYTLTPESRAELGRFFEAEEVERISEAHVIANPKTGRVSFSVPGHGSKWMHGLGRDTFFFKDAAATVATFHFQPTAGTTAGTTGSGSSSGGSSEAGEAPASALHLRQGPLDIRLARSEGGDLLPPVLPSL